MPARRRSPIWTISSSELQQLLNKSASFTEVFNSMGLLYNGAQLRALKIRIQQNELDLISLEKNRRENMKSSGERLRDQNKIPLNKILVKGSTYIGTTLRNRLIADGVLENKCSDCGNGPFWNGKPLTLQLDHIDGVRDDNRLENLRILCPNCHTQTPTFAGRQNKGTGTKFYCVCGLQISRKGVSCRKCRDHSASRKQPKRLTISNSELKTLIAAKTPYLQIAKEYNVSQTTVRKRCKKLGIYVNRRQKHN